MHDDAVRARTSLAQAPLDLRPTLLGGVSAPSRLRELLVLLLAAAIWIVVFGGMLTLTGSGLPSQLMMRLKRR